MADIAGGLTGPPLAVDGPAPSLPRIGAQPGLAVAAARCRHRHGSWASWPSADPDAAGVHLASPSDLHSVVPAAAATMPGSTAQWRPCGLRSNSSVLFARGM